MSLDRYGRILEAADELPRKKIREYVWHCQATGELRKGGSGWVRSFLRGPLLEGWEENEERRDPRTTGRIFGSLNLPEFGRHPRSHGSAVGVVSWLNGTGGRHHSGTGNRNLGLLRGSPTRG